MPCCNQSNHRAEVKLVALDIKGALVHVRWDGLLEHIWASATMVEYFISLNLNNLIDT